MFVLRCPYCNWMKTCPSDWTDEEMLNQHQKHANEHGVSWEVFLSDLQPIIRYST